MKEKVTLPSNPSDELAQNVSKPADSFVVVIKFGSNPLEDEQFGFSSFFKA